MRRLKIGLAIGLGFIGLAVARGIADGQYEMAAEVAATGVVMVGILWLIRNR